MTCPNCPNVKVLVTGVPSTLLDSRHNHLWSSADVGGERVPATAVVCLVAPPLAALDGCSARLNGACYAHFQEHLRTSAGADVAHNRPLRFILRGRVRNHAAHGIHVERDNRDGASMAAHDSLGLFRRPKKFCAFFVRSLRDCE